LGDLPLYSAFPTQMLDANQTTFQQASRLWVVTEPGRVEPWRFDFFVATIARIPFRLNLILLLTSLPFEVASSSCCQARYRAMTCRPWKPSLSGVFSGSQPYLVAADQEHAGEPESSSEYIEIPCVNKWRSKWNDE
jgi:hypothetical protein